MSYLVFKDGLPLFKDGLLQFSATSPPDPDCCCGPPPPVTDCCGNPIGKSLWCEVSHGCVGATPVEFVYLGLFGAFRRWQGTFVCPDASTVTARLQCNSFATSPSTAAWDLRFATGNTIGPGSPETISMTVSCTPFQLTWTIYKGDPGNPFSLCACASGPYTFTWTL